MPSHRLVIRRNRFLPWLLSKVSAHARARVNERLQQFCWVDLPTINRVLYLWTGKSAYHLRRIDITLGISPPPLQWPRMDYRKFNQQSLCCGNLVPPDGSSPVCVSDI